MKQTEPLQFYCSPGLKEKLREYSIQNDLSMGAVIRIAVLQLLRREGFEGNVTVLENSAD